MLSNIIGNFDISTHSLTKRLTACRFVSGPCSLHFNSQPHEEADFPYREICHKEPPHFNSQPHEEADDDRFNREKCICISTHSLTKRLTRPPGRMPGVPGHFNSQPHEEADTSFCLPSSQLFHFNSQPHEEADVW